LRRLWSDPNTRKTLLENLADKGFGRDALSEIQRMIDAEKSDLYDVLAYIAYVSPPITRAERAARAKVAITSEFNSKQQVFLDFVLSQYVKCGVDELALEKLTPLIRLKYNNAIADAIADLGSPEEINRAFTAFQRHLYERAA
jgi:type I restriction enzyme R subunit